MKVAVWRILFGCEIEAIHLSSEPSQFRLTIRLRTPYGENEPEYESQDSEDVRLLRHLGTVEVNGATRFQGYYAFA